jgi:hypothetical protein
MTVTRLTGGLTPADGSDPRTFPAIWDGFATDLEAGDYSRVPTGGSAGQVLVKDSATDYDAVWGFPSAPGVNKGFWRPFGVRGSGAGAQSTNNALQAFQIYFREPVTVNGFAVQIGSSGTGSAGAVLRIGLWDCLPSGLPGNLVYDAGTVDATQPAGTVLAITGFTLNLPAGFYWLGSVVQGSPATRPFFVGLDNPLFYQMYSSQSGDTPTSTVFDSNRAVTQTGVTGAFGATFTATPGNGGAGPSIAVRLAS